MRRTIFCLSAVLSAHALFAGLGLRVSEQGTVDVTNAAGRVLVTFDGVDLAFASKHFYKDAQAETRGASVHVDYAAPSSLPEELRAVEACGDFVREGDDVVVTYTVSGVTSNMTFRPGLCMIGRRYPKGMAPGETFDKGGYWVRDANGGLPYEEKLGLVVSYTNDCGGLCYVYRPKEGPNLKWQDGGRAHVRFVSAGEGVWTSTFRLSPAHGRSCEAIAVAAANRPAQVSFKVPCVYGLFGRRKPLRCLARVTSARADAADFDLAWTVRDFDGVTHLKGSRRVNLAAGACCEIPLAFDPDEDRGLYFVEVSARESEGGREAFARTNLARLPPYRFKAGPEESPFGLAAYWPIPDEESVQKLMDRMGVMWVRRGDTRIQHPPRRCNHHSSANFSKLTNATERTDWILKQLELCREQGNEYWEFANELNMSTGGIALKSTGIGRGLLVPRYAEYVREIDRLRRERGYEDVKLLSLGLAGFDEVFMRKMKEEGIWSCLSGFCLHPGRGNFTPDYPYVKPERGPQGAVQTDDPSKAERLENSNFWNFYGSVRGCQARIAEYGQMPLWLTEVYTPTYPNSHWEDTLRASAENVVLTYALIKADGIAAGFYYQLFDGVWFDKLGVNHLNREYYFGLINRDLSPKPAFMGYVAIAEALDGVRFVGWLDLPNETSHALAFARPDGTAVVVAWDRTDGYVLTKRPPKGERFRSPECWERHWKSSVPMAFPATAHVTCANAIGQERPLTVHSGLVNVDLTGAPVILRGLDLTRLKIVTR